MTNQDDLGALLPSRWKPASAAGATINVAPRRRSSLRQRLEVPDVIENIHTCVCYLCSSGQRPQTPIR